MMRTVAWLGVIVLGACAGDARHGLPPPSASGGPAPGPAPTSAPAPAPPSPGWHALPAAPFSGAGAALQLTDGTVLVSEVSTEHWWRLTPDAYGSYATGTWSPAADAPSGYSPLYFASAVLPDGKVIVEGGEYLASNMADTRRGAIYDPVADTWQDLTPPPGWSEIGDASGMVLASGTFMLSDCCTDAAALFDERTATWRPTGGGKSDINDEESWALLPDDAILTVDTNNLADVTQVERYDPATGAWMPDGDTPEQISDTSASPTSSHEIGPEVLRPDGTLVALGGNGHNVLYDTASKTWSTLPDLPDLDGQQLDIADGPAAMLPNGRVLIAASPGIYTPPARFFELYADNTLLAIGAPVNASISTSYQYSMLVLPTGEVLVTDFSPTISIYTPDPGVTDASVPVITSAPALIEAGSARQAPAPAATLGGGRPLAIADRPVATLFLGRSYEVAATRLAGVSQGAYYGDDLQAYTNYPLVRLTNMATGHVVYCRTYAHSTRSVAPDAEGTTRFDVPATAERGAAMLELVANGIASPGILVDVK